MHVYNADQSKHGNPHHEGCNDVPKAKSLLACIRGMTCKVSGAEEVTLQSFSVLAREQKLVLSISCLPNTPVHQNGGGVGLPLPLLASPTKCSLNA